MLLSFQLTTHLVNAAPCPSKLSALSCGRKPRHKCFHWASVTTHQEASSRVRRSKGLTPWRCEEAGSHQGRRPGSPPRIFHSRRCRLQCWPPAGTHTWRGAGKYGSVDTGGGAQWEEGQPDTWILKHKPREKRNSSQNNNAYDTNGTSVNSVAGKVK